MKFIHLYLLLLFIFLPLSGCTIYTEKRSEALSQAVYATSSSIKSARFDLAEKYSKEAEKLAFPPKKEIKISPIITKEIQTPVISVEKKSNTSESKLTLSKSSNSDILRLVIPEKLKNSKILIENSTEWNELIKTKEFSKQLEIDYQNLNKLQKNVAIELQKQSEMNNKMVKDLNIMQKKLVEKDLAILQRNVVIAILISIITISIYLRIKGIL